jgi:hypothetical protein
MADSTRVSSRRGRRRRPARAAGELLGSLGRPADPATASLARRIITAGRRLPHAHTAEIQHCHDRLTAALGARAVTDRREWTYLHADFHPRNLIRSAEGLVVIDPFGLAGPAGLGSRPVRRDRLRGRAARRTAPAQLRRNPDAARRGLRAHAGPARRDGCVLAHPRSSHATQGRPRPRLVARHRRRGVRGAQELPAAAPHLLRLTGVPRAARRERRRPSSVRRAADRGCFGHPLATASAANAAATG